MLIMPMFSSPKLNFFLLTIVNKKESKMADDEQILKKNLRENSPLVRSNNILKDWYIAGGASFFRKAIFQSYFPSKDFPETVNKCLCGRGIVEQCYVANIHTDKILTVGNCCQSKFPSKKKADENSDRTILISGDYRGRTFKHVLENHPEYCDLMLVLYLYRGEEITEAQLCFANWLIRRKYEHSEIMSVGKHKGRRYQWIRANDPQYCSDVVMTMDKPSPSMKHFQIWLCDNQ